MNFTFSTELQRGRTFMYEKNKFDISERFDTWRFALPYAHEKSRRVKDLCLAESGTHFTLSCVKTAASRSRRYIRDTWHSPPRDGIDDSRLNVVRGDAVGSSRCYTSFVPRHRHSIVLHQKLHRPCRWSPAAICNAERILKIAEFAWPFPWLSRVRDRNSPFGHGYRKIPITRGRHIRRHKSRSHISPLYPIVFDTAFRELDAIKSDCW